MIKIQTQNVMLNQIMPNGEHKQLHVTSGEKFAEALVMVLEETAETEVDPEEIAVLENVIEEIESDTTTNQDVSWAFWIKQFQQTHENLAGESYQESELVMQDIERRLPTNDQPLDISVMQAPEVEESIVSISTNPTPVSEEIVFPSKLNEKTIVSSEILEDVSTKPLSIPANRDNYKIVETRELSKTIPSAKVAFEEVQPVTPSKVDKAESSESQKRSEVIETKESVEAAPHQFPANSPSVSTITQKPQQNVPIKLADTEWVDQVEQIIVQTVEPTSPAEKVSTVHIQLTPENLGEMEIELILQNKELTAKLVVESEETKEWLEQKVTELTSKLAFQDIHIMDFEIAIAPRESSLMGFHFEDNPFFKQQKESPKHTKHFIKKSHEETESEKHRPNQKTATAGRISMWV